MKKSQKTWLVGTMAAAFLLGSAGLMQSQAFADSDDSSSAAATSSQGNNVKIGVKPGKHKEGFFGFFHGGQAVKHSADILGIEQSALMEEMKEGKTLLQIAEEKGLTQEQFLEQLTSAVEQSIDTALSEGKITQEQADKQKEGLKDRLSEEIQNTKLMVTKIRGEGPVGLMGFGRMFQEDTLTELLGITKEELQTELQAGKSLAEIAEAKGIAKEQLVNELKEGLTDQLTKLVENKGELFFKPAKPIAPNESGQSGQTSDEVSSS